MDNKITVAISTKNFASKPGSDDLKDLSYRIISLYPIELLDNKGNIMKDANNRELRFPNMQSAIDYANTNNINTTQVDWNWVCGARGQAPS